MRKLTADWVFDGSRLHPGAVLVLEEDGAVADLLLSGPDTGSENADAEYMEGVLTPGFINAHCHLELSPMKGLVQKGRGLVDFILQLQRSRHFPEEEVIAAMEQAESEMLAGGIVAVGDIANSNLSFSLKHNSRLQYHTFLEVFGFDPCKAEKILSDAVRLKEAFTTGPGSGTGTASPGVHASGTPAASGFGPAPGSRAGIVPHSPYSVSRKLFELIAGQAANGSGPELFSIHNQESAEEDLFYGDGSGDFNRLYREFGIDISFFRPYGCAALAAWLPWLGESGKILLVHNTYTRAEDIALASKGSNAWWCLCPNANLYIEQRLPDIPLFVEQGLNLVLGTDSLASNDRLSILEEMKTIAGRFPGISLEQLLQWATRNGAEFFGWEHLGSFKKGKKPGVNLLSGLDGLRPGENTRVTPLVQAGRPTGETGAASQEGRWQQGSE
ncbi:cytosine/adenosine deaminase-related metal-dependent hydrolase [Anseongella ginsenosidimutans]|uniref:Cytosine/adenosine deaminase-related metal-dependent hydrolase n=1 Tax=Anseongella ginsenosidimutans TaxID=496056 RepID=A0A4R3KWX8_9SPHI|nr:amidohydrolase family protein [Anseongella ginsenosidimutans]QEC51035.1 amidohydrolase family protein [Anseongella ginsenosidimutans]TCS90309.1 cytosine/adenosine deaminase-related metal-dependent hydrolase [Anseongella ginsenosidimutans]